MPHPQFSMHRVVTLFARAIRLRCPACGGRPIFSSWFRMLPGCTVCGLQFEREAGYQVGSYMVNIFAVEFIYAALLSGAIIATWPTPPWRELLYGSVVFMSLLPLALYPFTKTVFLALDLTFSPAAEERFGPED